MAAILYTDIRLNNYIKIEFCLKPETIIPLLHGTSQQKTTIQQKLIKYLMSLIILQHIIKIQMPKRKPLITNLAKPMVYIYIMVYYLLYQSVKNFLNVLQLKIHQEFNVCIRSHFVLNLYVYFPQKFSLSIIFISRKIQSLIYQKQTQKILIYFRNYALRHVAGFAKSEKTSQSSYSYVRISMKELLPDE